MEVSWGDIPLYPNLNSYRGRVGSYLKQGVLRTRDKKVKRKAIENMENPRTGRTQNHLTAENRRGA